MARSWCGFLPQNQEMKQQFSLLQTDPARILEALELALRQNGGESAAEEEDDFIVEFPKRH